MDHVVEWFSPAMEEYSFKSWRAIRAKAVFWNDKHLIAPCGGGECFWTCCVPRTSCSWRGEYLFRLVMCTCVGWRTICVSTWYVEGVGLGLECWEGGFLGGCQATLYNAPLHYVVLTKTAVIVKLTYVVDVAHINKLILVFLCAVIFARCFHIYFFNIYSRAQLALSYPGAWHCIY